MDAYSDYLNKDSSKYSTIPLLTALSQSKKDAQSTICPDYTQSLILWEELCIVYERLGKHREVLYVYVNVIRDYSTAEAYCISQIMDDTPFSNINERRDRVKSFLLHPHMATLSEKHIVILNNLLLLLLYLILERDILYTNAEENNTGSVTQDSVTLRQMACTREGVNQYISQFLLRYVSILNTKEVLNVLPDNYPLKYLAGYLQIVAKHSLFTKLKAKYEVSLLSKECLLYQLNSSGLKQRFVYINSARLCSICRKPLYSSTSAMYYSVFPSLTVAHFKCVSSNNLDPIRQVPFK